MTVLILAASTSCDPGIDLVMREIAARGHRAIRFDTDLYPFDSRFNLDLDPVRGALDRLTLTTPTDELVLSDVEALWIRHFDAGAGLPRTLAADHRAAACTQSDSAVWALSECLDVFALDPPDRLSRAPHKPRQLQLARAVGLSVPRTLLSNDADAVRAFYAECPAGVIAKLVESGSVSVLAENGDSAPLYTTSLREDDLEALDGLRYGPMLFQERIEKRAELRITVVGRQLFVAAVHSGGSAIGGDDWRRDRNLVGAFAPYDALPDAVAVSLLALFDRLGLNFGTVDLIRTPDERWVFIEVNTISYFDFVERAAGLPISAAIADLLLDRAPRR